MKPELSGPCAEGSRTPPLSSYFVLQRQHTIARCSNRPGCATSGPLLLTMPKLPTYHCSFKIQFKSQLPLGPRPKIMSHSLLSYTLAMHLVLQHHMIHVIYRVISMYGSLTRVVFLSTCHCVPVRSTRPDPCLAFSKC